MVRLLAELENKKFAVLENKDSSVVYQEHSSVVRSVGQSRAEAAVGYREALIPASLCQREGGVLRLRYSDLPFFSSTED
jgi:hypothetical protein